MIIIITPRSIYSAKDVAGFCQRKNRRSMVAITRPIVISVQRLLTKKTKSQLNVFTKTGDSLPVPSVVKNFVSDPKAKRLCVVDATPRSERRIKLSAGKIIMKTGVDKNLWKCYNL